MPEDEIKRLLKQWGKKVKDARGDRPMREIADKAGTTVATISRIENAQLRPTDELKIAIARACDRPVDELFPWPKTETAA